MKGGGLLHQFFESLKKYLINEFKDGNLSDYIPHYENLLQHKDKLEPLLDDLNQWKVDFHHEPDDGSGYTDGKIITTLWRYEDGGEPSDDMREEMYRQQEYADYHYEVELLDDPRYWGYCTCEPNDEGYDPNKKCCGNGCDWVAPRFELTKVEHLGSASFDGVEKDMCKLEEKWKKELEIYKNKEKQDKIDRLHNRMKEIEEEIERVKSE